MQNSPIFVHSIFRAGSTYIFNVFRRSCGGYWCYQEPLHEAAYYYRADPSSLRFDDLDSKTQLLRHPKLEKSYFDELIDVWPVWEKAINEKIIYEEYFYDPESEAEIEYWRTLARGAKGRPVFQECRTSGRIEFIKRHLEGSHVYLWRNPWDQWWSYKVTSYFDVVNLIIVSSPQAPPLVKNIWAELDIPSCSERSLSNLFSFYENIALTSEKSYLIFYLLWCLALREGMVHADLMINIDSLSDSSCYKLEILAALKNMGINEINFSDCEVPQGRYSERDSQFFLPLEIRVHRWLIEGGWTEADLSAIQIARERHRPSFSHEMVSSSDLIRTTEHESRARELAIRAETLLAQRIRDISKKLQDEQDVRFDDLAREAASGRAQILDLHAEIQKKKHEISEFKKKATFYQEETLKLQLKINGIYQSLSWRISSPLRWMAGKFFDFVLVVRNFLNYLLFFGIEKSQPLLGWLFGQVFSYPKIRFILSRWLIRYPELHRQLVSVAIRRNVLKEALLSTPFAHVHKVEFNKIPISGDFKNHPRVLPETPVLPEAMSLPELVIAKSCWVRLVGHVEGAYSLAIVNRGLAVGMESINEKRFSYIPYENELCSEMPRLSPEQDSLIHDALWRKIPSEEIQGTISIVHHYPVIADTQPCGMRGVLFFWEETSVPIDVVRNINNNFDIVWVAATSVKRALINSGCGIQVFVIPIGIDHLIDQSEEPIDKLTVSAGQVFRFLHVSSAFERKGIDVLLSAYLNTFTSADSVELYIKTFPNPHNKVHAQLKSLSEGLKFPPKVIIDENPLDDLNMLRLYRTAHCMVLPSRGEGFNLPAAEALALALPVITTGHSAHADFCTHATATLINFEFSASRSHLRSSDSCWVEPDPLHLADEMRRVREKVIIRDPELEARVKSGALHVRKIYTWANCASSLIRSAQWMQNQSRSESSPLRVAAVSPWATRCGIAEYANSLLSPSVYKRRMILKIYCDDRTVNVPPDAEIAWRAGENDSVHKLLERINQSNTDIVFVQHQPSLFPLTEALCEQLAHLSKVGVVVVLELHSTQPLLHDSRLTSTVIEALSKVDRIIVHKPQDLNNLLALGLVENVMLLQLGGVAPLAPSDSSSVRAELNIPSDALVLGCFGFALPHKGIDTLIKAIPPLISVTKRSVHLIAVTSILDKRSSIYIEECRKIAKKFGVEKNIHWMTDYLPIEDSQKKLGAADCVIFPYKHTQESSSAAVTVGLSTLKPVLVSPLEIFSDLADVTWRMDGSEVQDIVSAVSHLFNAQGKDNPLFERQEEWLRSHDWEYLSERLFNIIKSLRREKLLASVVA
ncbi:glycosyltransferase involved in cell wall biosynthesis [Acidovorax delafieldii]|uniref:Glycosyltransferase involved in cell wall biosynthesis n=1 Tax=Acidovorax delafieldii TaxID=47920 RepID=A0A561XS02_ACIDE|nr:glycosyltransferase [Acidovorax delafieldii]TWG38862.1 glycosyltransferase involved in cell wall biosynthesis [Acidovorax delafieldii]